MHRLRFVECPRCHSAIFARPLAERPPTASNYESCLRQCVPCGIGFSNAKHAGKVALIYREHSSNIPSEIFDGLNDAISSSLNEGTRPKKRVRLASSNSEDHVTWVVFRHLQLAGQLRAALARSGLAFASGAASEPQMLLWGSPIPATDVTGRVIREKLVTILNGLGEEVRQRSEPDVILDLGNEGIIFVEVKLRSDNKAQLADYPNWDKYLLSTEVFTSAGDVRQSGHYQLARNWRIAGALAMGRPMAIVNLVPESLYLDPRNRSRLAQFSNGINQTPHRHFVESTWNRFLGPLNALPEWLRKYLDERQVLSQKFTGFVRAIGI